MIAILARCLLIGSMVVGGVLPSSSALAQRVPSRALREIRDKLDEYEPGQALEAVASLTRLLGGGERLGPHDRSEARFLRAITAADLLLLAEPAGWGRLDVRVARALGVTVDSLRAYLDGELRAVEFGRFTPLSRDARAALAFGSGAPLEGNGPRLDLSRLIHASAAFAGEDPAEGLARLAADPCDPGPCEAPLHSLSERSRRALTAFRRGLLAAARLDLAREHGDPFSSAVDEEIDRLAANLARARLSVTPRPEPGLGAIEGEGEAGADVFVTVTEGAFIVQSAEIYGLSGGELRPVSPEACGRRVEVPLPERLGPRVVAVAALARALPRGCGGAVAIAAEDAVAAHLVLRALETVRSAGLHFAGLAGVDARGELSVHVVQIVHAAKRAQVGVAGSHLVIERGARRDQIPLESLAVAREDELGRVFRALGPGRAESPLRVAGDVPFLALRVILRALHGKVFPPAP